MKVDQHTLERLRSADLPSLAERFGYQHDRSDKHRWKRPGSILSINGSKFYDHMAAKGGHGAIDLVMCTQGASFLEAVRMLGGLPTPVAAARPGEPDKSRKLHIPEPCQRLWPSVCDYLVNQRGLDPGRVETCWRQETLFADHRQNAVFRCRNANQQTTGAELVGTRGPFRGMAPGSKKSAGGFHVRTAADPKTVILVESAIDALSLASLHDEPAIIVSTTGVATRLPGWVDALSPETILCAFDADQAGDQAAKRLQDQDKRIRRWRPENGKDWNEILQNQN